MKKQGNLVRLLDLDQDFIIELIYATPNNFTGSVVYNFTDCCIDIETGKRLVKAKDMAREAGFRMKVWDAFRPTSAQQKFWDLLPDNNFVAYPPDMDTIKEFKNSHMNGQCVDVTLVDQHWKPSEIENVIIPILSMFMQQEITKKNKVKFQIEGRMPRIATQSQANG